MELIFRPALMYRCFNFWRSLNVKNTLKPTYNSPITGDFGGPAHDSDETAGQRSGGPVATTWGAVTVVRPYKYDDDFDESDSGVMTRKIKNPNIQNPRFQFKIR